MNQKLYVGNLSYDSTDQDLQDLFSQHGTVQSANVVTDRYTGRSRGFGFVEMSTAEEAQQAITALNGQDFQGRNLVINEARPQEKRSFGDRPPR
ncbi:MAG: RNA-binding protein [Nitrospirales bacterium]|nr:RNA-binding protein [Nitrospirales bacterium]